MSAVTTAVAAIDGGSRGNPGEAGCGIVLDLAGHGREEHTLYLGKATNNVAEYAALLAVLERARAIGIRELEVRSDSELLVRQMTGSYRVKAPHLQRLWLAASQLARTFGRLAVRHIPRERNGDADRLANQAIDSRSSTLPRPAALP
ncbi:MAG: ribonuclease HI family protein [Acidobacteriota bacterium]